MSVAAAGTLVLAVLAVAGVVCAEHRPSDARLACGLLVAVALALVSSPLFVAAAVWP